VIWCFFQLSEVVLPGEAFYLNINRQKERFAV